MRRLTRSPTCPNSTPPSGRVKKPDANTPYEANRDRKWFPSGKKFAPNVAAKKPYAAKSYHSSVLPIAAATCGNAGPRRDRAAVKVCTISSPKAAVLQHYGSETGEVQLS